MPRSLEPLPIRQPVIQKHPTGCAIASVAVLARTDYDTVYSAATRLAIDVKNPALWSSLSPIRKLMSEFDLTADTDPTPFSSWDTVPPLAVMAIKWHLEGKCGYWHWVVYERTPAYPAGAIYDSKAALKKHVRTDFGRIHPKWWLSVHKST